MRTHPCIFTLAYTEHLRAGKPMRTIWQTPQKAMKENREQWKLFLGTQRIKGLKKKEAKEIM